VARTSGLWFRARDRYYMTTFRGKQVKLSRDKKEAQRALHALLAAAPADGEESGYRPTFRKIADRFLDHVKQVNASVTYHLRRRFLQSLCDHVKNRKAMDVRVADVTDWLLAHRTWAHNSQVTARAIVRSCFNWAVDQSFLPHSPVARLKLGTPHRRNRILTADERRRVRDSFRDVEFKDFLFFLEQTGCRPYSEAGRLTATMVDAAAGTITFVKHKTAHKGKTRVVYMTPAVADLVRRRCLERPEGPLFRTRHGQPYTAYNTTQRLRRAEVRAGVPRFSLNAYRKSYITEALERGLSSDLVAELCGNTSKTIGQYYNLLSEKKNTLREAARRAVGQ
jgi:integrase